MHLLLPFQAPPVECLDWEEFAAQDIVIKLLRLDLVHPDVGGNKWFKLGPGLQQAKMEQHKTVLSFGGAYSNHLRALSAVAKICGLQSIGMVRGEIPQPLNRVLQFAAAQGMVLHPLTRGDYRRRDDPEFQVQLSARFGSFYLLPAGGGNRLGVTGAERIVDWLGQGSRSDWVVMACGTGTTMAGVINGLASAERAGQVVGVAVLKAGGFLVDEVSRWLSLPPDPKLRWHIETGFAHGGFGKSSADLDEFVGWFRNRFGIPTEPVYTGKVFYALRQLLRAGTIPPGTDITVLHTGGVH
ncbi:MAG: pyridoxal-phosphate dependent enzyme [Pseudohongiellaceae bacterium]